LLFESNSLNNFLDERVTAAPGRDVTTNELQSAYISYCNTLGIPSMGVREVATRLVTLMKDKFGAAHSNMVVRGACTVRGYRNVELLNS